MHSSNTIKNQEIHQANSLKVLDWSLSVNNSANVFFHTNLPPSYLTAEDWKQHGMDPRLASL